MMNAKGQVLTCVAEGWQNPLDIAREVAFVYKAEYTDAHVVMVALLLFQLKSDRLVEEHDFGYADRLNLYRLSLLGEKQQAELLAGNQQVLRAKEDFILAGCPI